MFHGVIHKITLAQFFETRCRIIGLHVVANDIDLSLFAFFWWVPKDYFIFARVTFRPLKVIQGHWF